MPTLTENIGPGLARAGIYQVCHLIIGGVTGVAPLFRSIDLGLLSVLNNDTSQINWPSSQAKNPTVIQAHLKKLFQGIHSVEFNEQDTKITAMISACGEKVGRESKKQLEDSLLPAVNTLALEKGWALL